MDILKAINSHRRPLKRFVVLGYEDGYFIALKGFRSLWRAERYARHLEKWVTPEAQIVDSVTEGDIYSDESFRVSDFRS